MCVVFLRYNLGKGQKSMMDVNEIGKKVVFREIFFVGSCYCTGLYYRIYNLV